MYAQVSPSSGFDKLYRHMHSISWLWMAILAMLALFVTLALRLAAPAAASLPSLPGAGLSPQSDVVRTVMTYVSDWDERRDPLVPAGQGVVVKRSNYQGIVVDGKRYYYSLAPHMSFDPVSRGAATKFNVVYVSPDQSEVPVIIYTLD